MVLMKEQQRTASTTEVTSTALVATQPEKGEYANKPKLITDIAKKEWSIDKKCDNYKKAGYTIDDFYYLKGFPSTHPLHGVFPNTDKEKFKKNHGKRGAKGYLAESSKESEKEVFSEKLLLKLKQIVEPGKEAKANLATSNSIPFTTFLTFLKHKCFFIQSRERWIIDTGPQTIRVCHTWILTIN